jgi:pseudo-rSAM protein
MNDLNQKKWFSLFPSVFIWRKTDECLFYDSNTFRSKRICMNNSGIEAIVNYLQIIDNLYCIEIDKTLSSDKQTLSFLEELAALNMGMIVKDDGTGSRRPVQLPPILNLQSAVERLNNKDLTDLTAGENILDYVHEIHLLLSDNMQSKTIESIMNLLDSLRKSNLYTIKISGYIHALNKLMEFRQLLNTMPAIKTVVLDFKDDIFDSLWEVKGFNMQNLRLFIRVTSGFNKELYCKVENFLQSEELSHEYEFAVSSEDEFEDIQAKIQDVTPESMDIKPIFNGRNHIFFENNVYLDEEDCLKTEMTKRDIFAHQVLNMNDFGKLTFTSDGKVYANPYFPLLGTVENDIREIVYKEMLEGASWRRIRDMKPCCECIYQWLCPPLSNYELALGKPNLCHVKP